MRDYISLDVRQAVQRGDVLAELTRARPHLLHVSGHGDQDGQFLADDKRIDPAALASVIAELRKDGHPIAGVILNACWSAAAVPLLSAAGVVAMGWREPIIDEDAIAFSRSLYETLGNQPDPITADLAQCARIARANLAVLNLNPPDLEISRPGGAE
ncbi:MAG: hypothetical protein K0R83_2876 [Caulobacter sp.]|nr:hypothetical protein [Caulobacter sp.]